LSGDRNAPLAERIAASALTLAARRVLVTGMSAVGTAVVARLLGVGSFGELSSALAAFWLAAALSDFGFGLVLGRDLAFDPPARGRLLRAALHVQVAWSLLPALALVALAGASGFTETRGLVLLVLAPAVAFDGLGGARQMFFVLYRTRQLAAIDIATNVVQLGAMVAVAAAGGGPVGVAATLSLGSILNTVAVARAGFRLVDGAPPTAADRRRLLTRALPLGLASFTASVYFTADLVLLGWLVDRSDLGEYAAACKVLSLLVAVPGLVMLAALPGLATAAQDRDALTALAARVGHWLVVLGLPLCVGAGVFARPLVHVLFGAGYDGAIPLLRILALAGAIAMLGNLLGTLLVARSVVRPMLVQNALAAVLNVGGNLLLVPVYGVTASAWLTVATEIFVCASSLYVLRGRVGYSALLNAATRPAVALVGMAATGAALQARPALGIPAAGLVFFLLLQRLHAWPVELQPDGWSRGIIKRYRS
jgi:O-antigen/teichoic acid export membrane protein